MSLSPSLLAELKATLDTKGFRAALEMLNQRVPHRYTVVYRFDGEAFYGMVVVDKLKEPPPVLFNKVPFGDSFCQHTVCEASSGLTIRSRTVGWTVTSIKQMSSVMLACPFRRQLARFTAPSATWTSSRTG